MCLFDTRQRLQRSVSLSQVTLAAGDQIKHVMPIGRVDQQRLRDLQGLRMLPIHLQLANVLELKLQWRESGVGGRGVHGYKKTFKK
jgi:hypothetical protein